MIRVFEGARPALTEVSITPDVPAPGRLAPAPSSRLGVAALVFAAVLSVFWVGVWGGYLWGWFGPAGLLRLGLQQQAVFAAAIVLPPLLFLATAFAFARAAQMGRAAAALTAAADALFAVDVRAAEGAAHLGRSVRREIDALNSGLDGAVGRLRTLETAIENRLATLNEAGARLEARGEALALRLGEEAKRVEGLADHLGDAAQRAGETMAGRAAQVQSGVEGAESALKRAAQTLEAQAAAFRAAVQAAAGAPHAAALELDDQAKKIEDVSDAVLARAEFVLARQEKHRLQMAELLSRLDAEGTRVDAALVARCAGVEQAIGSLGVEAQRFEALTGEAERNLDLVMTNAANRAGQLSAAFAAEAACLTETAEAANVVLSALTGTLREAGAGAQALIGESAAQARQDARELVGEAMAECEKLLRAAGEMEAEAGRIRAALAGAVEDVEKHLVRLPTLAQDEAQRVRRMVQGETEQMLDMSARTLSALHARAAGNRPAQPPAAEAQGEGLKTLARKLTQRPRRDLRHDDDAPAKSWEMKTLLAAAEAAPELGVGTAAALGALEAALADMAVDLGALDAEAPPADEDWKRYLTGDRAVFARRLAGTIDAGTVDRITALYRDDSRFHEAADAYLAEFESLLSRARQGDGAGLLTPTILTADTGKIYLAVAYALGRL